MALESIRRSMDAACTPGHAPCNSVGGSRFGSYDARGGHGLPRLVVIGRQHSSIWLSRTLTVTLALLPLSASAAEAAHREGQGASRTGADPLPPSAPDPEVAQSAAAIEPPVLERFVEATYPAAEKAKGSEAIVVLELSIGTSGDVVDAEVVTSAGADFDAAALAAARRFAFRPARRGGVPVAARIRYSYAFNLAPVPENAGRVTAPPAPSVADSRASLKGIVHMAEQSVPLAGATVELLFPDGTRRTEITAEDGSFRVDGLPAGTCQIIVDGPGFASAFREVALAPSKQAAVTISLEPATDQNTIQISVSDERRSALSEHTLSARELETMPGTLGDALRAVQNMPGVGVPPLGNAGLVVRGLGPRANLVLADGLLILNPYHLWGVSSVVPTEMLESLEFYPGNYGVEYGRSTGGMIELKTRRAKEDSAYHGVAQVDMLDSRLMLEGPVPSLEGWSFIGGVRRSHIDKTLMPMLGLDVTPVYYDYQFFADTRPSPKSRLRLGIFGSDDRTIFGRGYDVVKFRQSYAFWYVTSRYDAQLGDDLLWQHTTAFGYLRTHFQLETPTGSIGADAPAYPVALRTSLTWQSLPELAFRVGTDIHYAPFDATMDLPGVSESDAQPGEGGLDAPMVHVDARELYFRPAAFAEAVFTPSPRAMIVAGVRGDYSYDIDGWDASPRIRASYALGQPGTQTKLKAGAGFFHQPPQPEEVVPGYGTQKLESSRAFQTSLGIEQRLFDAFDLNVEGYYYRLSKLVESAANAQGTVRFVNQGEGHAYGLESLLRYDEAGSDVYGWLAYTLSRSMRRPDSHGSYELAYWDQTHILTALGSYRLGRGWELGARFQYVSGMPYTPVVRSLYGSASDSYVPVYGERSSRRFPAYHQLDLRAEKHWQIAWLELTAYLDVINAYASRRVTDVRYNEDFSDSTYVRFPLPMIPSVGLRGEF